MKKTVISRGICAIAILLVVVALAGRASSQSDPPSQKQCSAETKEALYVHYQENSKRDRAQAFGTAREYLACAPDLNDRQDVLAELNFAVGQMLSSKTPGEAIPFFIKAASCDSKVKTTPLTYLYLAEAYDRGPYTKLADEYRSRFQGKDESEESLLALENLNQIIDRMIDAYARAVALAGVELPKETQPRSLRAVSGYGEPSDWMNLLIDLYKFRHKTSRAGLKELISTILSKPVLPEPIPIVSLPARQK